MLKICDNINYKYLIVLKDDSLSCLKILNKFVGIQIYCFKPKENIIL